MFRDIIKKGVIKIDGSEKRLIAHKDKNKTEYLNEHNKKTKKIFKYLIETENVYKTLFKAISNDYNLNYTENEFKNLLLEMAEYHDIGKLNPKFQKETIKNPEFKNYKTPNLALTSEHSEIGSLFFSARLMEKNAEKKPPILVLPYIIKGHHTRVRSIYESSLGIANTLKKKKTATGYLREIIPEENKLIDRYLQEVMDTYGNRELRSQVKEDSSALSFFYNYIYSTLIRADSIATNYAYSEINEINQELPKYIRRITPELIKKIEEGYKKKQTEYEGKIEETPLNKYRNEMQKKAFKSLDKGLKKGNSVFYLQMPTGGGKTHTAIGLTIKLLKETKANRVIYNLPYISLLEQNHQYFQEITGLDQKQLRSIHSLSDVPTNEKEEMEKIIFYDDFFEYPMICTTMVSFFNSIIKFNKYQKYRFGALSNSIIILDEIQTLPVEYWPEFNYLLNEMAEKLNSYILIMSATVPELYNLKHTKSMAPEFKKDCHHLIKNPEKYYAKFKRNKIKNKKFEEIQIDKNGFEKLSKSVIDKYLKEIEEHGNNGLVVVNTIQTSKNLYEQLQNDLKKIETPTSCLLLNSTILTSQKKEILNKIQSNNKENILLISTQTIEAGLDVSFDFVIRDFAILESIEQVRGRCNRNKEKPSGNVYLLKNIKNQTEAKYIYPKWRLKETEKILKQTNFSYNHKDIKKYYKNTINTINQEISKETKLTSAKNNRNWNKIKFEEKNSPKNKNKDVFHIDIIEENQNTYDFYIETEIKKEAFTEKELEYIQNKLKIPIKNQVNGSEIIEKYIEKIKKQKENYTEKKILKKQFKSIINKFTVSAAIPNIETEINQTLKKIGPYHKIPKHLIGEETHHLYSKTKGLNKKYFSKTDEPENKII
ncbi:CRISPR-associated helicase Cas3' [Methanonatronarchaeum sp. AMET-Sl]|uniref:CRISPR-associated helicase Cas3' n=1 Tax=Methanonatronarchaeum sp. AMET-Sl TaxID=3037654 RepID=UPI00244DFC62|nr:CRISPR-associated helicase Cas3' [Methanonatronarchaeum sp. AMET-Sl]WGI17902.1 CRISPR-associated helicase Cas3' [Methanonatronarchaeum sp. AMET-Sl]